MASPALSRRYAYAFCLCLGVGLAPAHAAKPGPHSSSAAQAAQKAGGVSRKEATNQALRDLWGQHVFWVRNYVVASVDEQKGARDVAGKQVVANARAIAAAMAPYYGEAAGDQLFQLLGGHWAAVKAYSDAADTPAREQATADLGANAEAIAAFLAKANPYLKKDTVLALLTAHGGHHVLQIDQLKAGDYAGEAQTWEVMRPHILSLADALTTALARQFPMRF